MSQQHIVLSARLKIFSSLQLAFSLPGKKKLSSSDSQIELVVVDVTARPIERPKKNRNSSIVGKRKDTD